MCADGGSEVRPALSPQLLIEINNCGEVLQDDLAMMIGKEFAADVSTVALSRRGETNLRLAEFN